MFLSAVALSLLAFTARANAQKVFAHFMVRSWHMILSL